MLHAVGIGVPHVMTFLIVCEVMGCLPTVADSLESRDLRR